VSATDVSVPARMRSAASLADNSMTSGGASAA